MNGIELKEKRKKLNLTQTELAEKVGVAMRTVQNWEKEVNKIPKSTELLIDDLIRSTEISYLNTPTKAEEPSAKYGNEEKINIESPSRKENDNDPGIVSRLVKDKLDVTADFYALKHLFLDELDKASDINLNLSKGMASHETNVTEKVYLVGRNNRKNEALKKINICVINQ